MRGKRRRGSELSVPLDVPVVTQADMSPDPDWRGTCLELPGRRRVLIDEPSDGCMQAVVGGILEFGPAISGYEYLSLWAPSGAEATVVVLPHGSTAAVADDGSVTVTVFGVELALGDEVNGGGGGVRPPGSAPLGTALSGEASVQALQSLQVGERSLSVLDFGPY